jgi:OPA family glycerol-3-phosphate transporter-like MFS transporter 1/2
MLSPNERHMSVPGKDVVINQKIGEENLLVGKRTCLQLWRIPAVPEVTATVLCLKVVRYCMIMWLPMYLNHYLQYSVAQAGLFSTIFDVGGSLGSPFLGYILDRKFKKNALLGMWVFVTMSSISLALFAMTARLGFIHNAIFMLITGMGTGGADSLLGI